MKYFVIYQYPSDYPNKIVVRRYTTSDSGDVPDEPNSAEVFETLRQARESIPEYLTCFTRHKSDDEVIIETWL